MIKVKITLELNDSWDEYKETMFIEDFLKEDIGQVINDNLNGVVITDLRVLKDK